MERGWGIQHLTKQFMVACPLLLLRTFSAHAKVVARDAKEMRNTQDTRSGFVSCKSGRFYLYLAEKMRRFSTDEK